MLEPIQSNVVTVTHIPVFTVALSTIKNDVIAALADRVRDLIISGDTEECESVLNKIDEVTHNIEQTDKNASDQYLKELFMDGYTAMMVPFIMSELELIDNDSDNDNDVVYIINVTRDDGSPICAIASTHIRY